MRFGGWVTRMQHDRPPDPHLEQIRSAIRLYHRGASQGTTAAELINGVFLNLGQFERYDLVAEVVPLIPESVQGEFRRHVEAILRPGAADVPFFIGGSPDHAAWCQRMVPACRRLAALFREYLDGPQPGPGRTGT